MSRVEVVLDGATEPAGPDGTTSLQRARTSALDALAAAGTTTLRATIPAGLPAGTETAMPVLLGWTPPGRVDRAALEAAARRIAIPDGGRAHRIDAVTRSGRATLRHAGFRLHEIGRGRVLAIGPETLPVLGPASRVWSGGVVPPGGVLDARTVLIAAPGAAAGAASLLGARVVVPAGATGDTDSNLRAKADAALRALEEGAHRIVVHVGGPDAAAHRRDEEAKVCAIEAADRHLIGPLRSALAHRGNGSLAVGADHGCDPVTGRHDAAPVPWTEWSA